MKTDCQSLTPNWAFQLCNNFNKGQFFDSKNISHCKIQQGLHLFKNSTYFFCFLYLFCSKHKSREQDHSRSSSSSASPSSPSSREEKESKKEREEEFKTHHELKEYSGFGGVSRPRGTFVSNKMIFDHLIGLFTLEYCTQVNKIHVLDFVI